MDLYLRLNLLTSMILIRIVLYTKGYSESELPTLVTSSLLVLCVLRILSVLDPRHLSLSPPPSNKYPFIHSYIYSFNKQTCIKQLLYTSHYSVDLGYIYQENRQNPYLVGAYSLVRVNRKQITNSINKETK